MIKSGNAEIRLLFTFTTFPMSEILSFPVTETSISEPPPHILRRGPLLSEEIFLFEIFAVIPTILAVFVVGERI